MVVHLIFCSIINGKSGRCSENCKYCAQSVYYQTGIDIYSLLKISEIKAIALHNQKQGVERFFYCDIRTEIKCSRI